MMWVTVEDCARWLDTTADMVRVLGLRGRFAYTVDIRGVMTHIALPHPEAVPPEGPDRAAEVRGRLSFPREAGGGLSVPDGEDR